MQKVKDYFTIWNTGVSFIYGILGVIYSYAIIETVETYNKYKEYYSMSSKSIWTPGMVLTIIFSIVFLATGVLNLIHTRKYFRNDNPRSPLGYTALGMLIVSTGYFLVRIIIGFIEYASALNGSGGYTNSFNIPLFLMDMESWLTWVFLAMILFNFVSATLSLIWLIKNRDSEGESIVVSPLGAPVIAPTPASPVSPIAPSEPSVAPAVDNTPSQGDPLANNTVNSDAIYPNPFAPKE